MATESSVMAVIRASRPSFRNGHDKVAFAVHAAFLAAGYALDATGKAALSDPPPAGEVEVGIEGWNEFEDSYGFVYTKKEKGVKKSVLVKCLAIGDVLAIDALDLGQDQKEPFNLQIKVTDYSSNGSSGNYEELYKNFGGLVGSLYSGVLAKLEAPPTSRSSSSADRREISDSRYDQPALGVPVEPQPYSTGFVLPLVPPSAFNDLEPGPAPGVYPGRDRFRGDGSILIGPNDPRWFGGARIDRPGFPGSLGGIPGVPPGARFDPYGPPGVPGFEPQRFVRQPRRPGGGTHPDLEHFQGPDYL